MDPGYESQQHIIVLIFLPGKDGRERIQMARILFVLLLELHPARQRTEAITVNHCRQVVVHLEEFSKVAAH
jgi:hypothetical protein